MQPRERTKNVKKGPEMISGPKVHGVKDMKFRRRAAVTAVPAVDRKTRRTNWSERIAPVFDTSAMRDS